MPKNIERRSNTWYATLHVPLDVRSKIGKSKFFLSLKTTDKRVAEDRASRVVAGWKDQISAARGNSDPFIDEMLAWRRELDQAELLQTPEEASSYEILSGLVSERAEEIARREGNPRAQHFYRVAHGEDTLLSQYFDEWASHLGQAPKTIDQMKKDVKRMIDHFVTVEAVTKSATVEWVKELMHDKPDRPGYSASSLDRIFKFSRSFWKYLQEAEVADPERHPFVLPSFAMKRGRAKGKGKDGWEPFTPSEVTVILAAAIQKGDEQLADIIRLGMYTGARIEELAALKLSDCTVDVLNISDSKTEAGVRQVPVHPELVQVIKRLTDASKDEYLLSGLTFNKYGDRSNAIGKRFGRLKASLGFPQKKVFHSIRKTVVTMLENAGVAENLTADIVGHEKPRITYGLYSGGHSVSRMKDAIELLKYPAAST